MSNQMLSPVVRIVMMTPQFVNPNRFFFSWQDLELDLSQGAEGLFKG